MIKASNITYSIEQPGPPPRPSRALAAYAVAGLSVVFVASLFISTGALAPHERYFTLCLFKILTGLPCPACGLTHSFCALTKGDLLAALGFNLLGPPMFALLALTWVRSLGVVLKKTRFASAFDSAVSGFRLVRVATIAFVIFGAARIIYVLVYHPGAFAASPLMRFLARVFR